MGSAIELKIEIVDMEVTPEEKERYVAALRRVRQVIEAEFPGITVLYPWEAVEPGPEPKAPTSSSPA